MSEGRTEILDAPDEKGTVAVEAARDTGPLEEVAKDDPNIGRLIDGKYRMEKLIGVGGMGRVYRGTNLRTDSPVAIKTLNPELIEDQNLVKRFEVEAKVVANLNHPNTIRMYDFGQDTGMLFMVMELLKGESLDDRISGRGAMPPRRAITIMREVLGSLSEAHGEGLVHRDLKPDNIFLNRVGGNEHVKVLDFGVAKLKENKYNNNTLTQFGMIFGTPRYMSPEQARAQDLDGRSDIYALGVILFEMVTGKVPFDANDPVGVLIKHVQEPPPRPSGFVPGVEVHPDLEDIILRCMEKEADRRYATVEALDEALQVVDARIAGGEGASFRTSTVAQGGGETSALPASQGDSLGLGPATAYAPSVAGPETQLAEPVVAPRGGLPKPLIAVIGLLVVAVVGVGAMVLRPSAPPEVPVEPPPAVAAPNPGPALEAVQRELAASALAGMRAAEENVVRFELSASNVDDATVSLEGADTEPLALPHTFHFRRAADDAEPMVFVIEAPGHETMRQNFNGRSNESRAVSLSRRQAVQRPAPSPAAAPRPSTPPRETSPPPRPPPRAPGSDRLVDPYAD